MKLLTIALGAIILVSLGCNRSQNKQPNTQNQLEWAYQLIDEGYYSESIDLFTNILQQEDSPTIRLGLASAYAARAGVKVHSYWDLILPSMKSTPPTTFESNATFRRIWYEKLEQLPPEAKREIAPQSESVFQAHLQMENLKWRFEKIPVISTDQQSRDLLMARLVTSNIPSKGARLYRSLLGLILIKYELNRSSHLLQQSLQEPNQWPCPVALRKWFHQIPIPLALMSDILRDVKYAYPKKVHEIEPFERDFENYHGKILSSLNHLEPSLCANH